MPTADLRLPGCGQDLADQVVQIGQVVHEVVVATGSDAIAVSRVRADRAPADEKPSRRPVSKAPARSSRSPESRAGEGRGRTSDQGRIQRAGRGRPVQQVIVQTGLRAAACWRLGASDAQALRGHQPDEPVPFCRHHRPERSGDRRRHRDRWSHRCVPVWRARDRWMHPGRLAGLIRGATECRVTDSFRR